MTKKQEGPKFYDIEDLMDELTHVSKKNRQLLIMYGRMFKILSQKSFHEKDASMTSIIVDKLKNSGDMINKSISEIRDALSVQDELPWE